MATFEEAAVDRASNRMSEESAWRSDESECF